MAQARIRRSRTTLLEQISVMEPTNLRDFLNIRQEDNIPAAAATAAAAAGRRSANAVTLASILESEKRGERRLLDILREEDGSRGIQPEASGGRVIRVPLMTLMGLTEEEVGEKATTVGDVVAEEMVCCVCLVRKKGAAFIPCGHTYCRVCSRELKTGRGSCPLCNGVVVDVLDLF
ncbi:putative E3 ubiquitin-protein ligase XBAT35 [Phalaenopsis equestris]|uniref:putative E3 ubiquitin-protein ligase XBAT35 n=1 Tax=Phalaenopsis equestris TaxID=78828 RepID=UPI0009E3A18B|nr:putative E3 ubiquitin-protein ligase XBAT35 [Phalaenopsis equestris]